MGCQIIWTDVHVVVVNDTSDTTQHLVDHLEPGMQHVIILSRSVWDFRAEFADGQETELIGMDLTRKDSLTIRLVDADEG